ncbi:hypothetical protein AB205_0068750 [Aquarana catesbeiana]|uniref:SRCR domain-containing protein n=1 Tax=Aquarana catesbeiana TaxID=8400 RepID=A0A2G9SJP8_AQUCT|nr:hypothetical protein AB205_0068750 [Aquarana catesbeiana]
MARLGETTLCNRFFQQHPGADQIVLRSNAGKAGNVLCCSENASELRWIRAEDSLQGLLSFCFELLCAITPMIAGIPADIESAGPTITLTEFAAGAPANRFLKGQRTDVLQDLRLAGGDGRCEGRVEVNIQGEWGTVCDDAWSDKNTEVVCRQLGCPQAPTHSVKASSFGAGIGKVWLTDVTCSGEETSLKECKYSIEEGDICDHRNDVGVICSGEAEMLRLVGGGSECEGRVEVKHRGEWGTVCGVNWRRQEAAVVCRQLGCNFTNIIQVRAASFGAGSGRIWLSHVKCAWDEPDLWACQHRMWGSGRCKHQDDAGVICSAAPVEPRLVGGDTECEGRLEVKHQGEWGTVCGESWQEKEAAVVCRHLGCSSSHGEAVLVQATSFGPGSGKIWLSDVTCAGQESDLWQCKHQMWGNPFCQHKQDVGVICAGEITYFQTHLRSVRIGKVELKAKVFF